MSKFAKSLDFSGDNIAVVGGSSGIGAGVAQSFYEHGARVFITGTKPSIQEYENTEQLEKFEYSQVDVSDREQLTLWANKLPEQIRSLVLCQGTVQYKQAEFGMEVFDRIVNVNLHSMMQCMTLLREKLKAHPSSSAITVSSIMAYKGSRGNPAYSASKWGLRGLTQTMADAFATDGIRVNGIAPGFVATKLTQNTVKDPNRLKGALKNIPIGRLGTPEDMAGAALFLASDMSSYIMGQTLVVDGGILLR